MTTMKSLTNLREIPALTSKNVHIRNEVALLNKINKIILQGHENLQIVTDFDHTLTRHAHDNGTPVLTSFGMFTACPSVPQHYKDEDIRLANIYKPIECDGLMSIEEKTKHMVDWYHSAKNLLKGLMFPRKELQLIAQNMKECYRIGVRELIDWCDGHKVPVLVFSAGLGDCVVCAIEASNFMRPNVKVVANFIDMDKNDQIVGMKGEIIHTLNKNETAIKNSEYYEMVKDRSNVILMGDNTGDAGMAEGMEHCNVVIKIGFLNRNVDENIKYYCEIFDIVLVHENSMNVPNSILALIAN